MESLAQQPAGRGSRASPTIRLPPLDMSFYFSGPRFPHLWNIWSLLAIESENFPKTLLQHQQKNKYFPTTHRKAKEISEQGFKLYNEIETN